MKECEVWPIHLGERKSRVLKLKITLGRDLGSIQTLIHKLV